MAGESAKGGWRRAAALRVPLVVLALLLSAGAATSETRAPTPLPSLDRFTAIGFGLDFLERLNERGTCRDLEERVAGAGTQGIVDVFGMAGVIGGALLGSDLTRGSLGGSILGGIAGGYVAAEAGRGVAAAAEGAVRSESDQFIFEVCKAVMAADALKRPMLVRYIQIAEAECAVDPQLISRLENRDWNMLVDCNNGRSEEARQITLQIIRINQATCFAIDALGRALSQTTPDRGMPTIDESVDPECDERSPGAVWQSYLRDRM